MPVVYLMEPFKNRINEDTARRIARAIRRAHPGFSETRFVAGVKKELSALELKARVEALSRRLHAELPPKPALAFPALIEALRLNPEDSEGLSGFEVWPLTQYVMEHGLTDFEASMQAMYHMTQVFTAEFAIRPFLLADEERTLARLRSWLDDPSHHVRRLISEGTRPVLPWGIKLPAFVADPSKTWDLLEALKHDPTRYVQTSVSNHIKDHTRWHADWVLKHMRAWRRQFESEERLQWIIKQATRNLVKQGHPGALELRGIKPVDFTGVKTHLKSARVKVGGDLKLALSLRNPTARAVSVIADVEVLFVKANGSLSPKVFKGRSLSLEAGAKGHVELKIPLRQVTTRRYYPGRHGASVILNGRKLKTVWFQLRT